VRSQGRIIQWLDGEGHGLIKCNETEEEIFVEAQALPQRQDAPRLGELVSFELQLSESGMHAVRLQYVNRPHFVIKPARIDVKPRKKNFSSLVIMMVFGFFVLNFMAPHNLPDAIESGRQENAGSQENQRPNVDTRFECEGKKSCADLSACEEAVFYVENCPDTLLDMDILACKTRWCNVDLTQTLHKNVKW